MSKVEWKTLRDVCCFKKGQMITLKTAIKGSVPVISSGQQPSFYHNCANRNGETIVVAGSGAYAGFVSYWDTPIFVADAFSVSPKNLQTIIVKYLFYYLQNNQETIYHTKTTGGIPHVYSRFIENYIIPIPPKHIQQQIVNQLDIFTTLIAKLESELTLRQKQYEFYREKLLNFDGDEEVEWKTLGEVAPLSIERIASNLLSSDNYVSVENLLSNKEGKRESLNVPCDVTVVKYKKGDVLIGNIRPYLKKIWFADNDGGASPDVLVFSLSKREKIISGYLYHLLASDAFFNYVDVSSRGGKMPRGDKQIIKNYPIPIPSKHRQQQIVSQLDTFEQLIAALKREIALRQKQYEFYREKLLTFE